ncbi:DNA cytosine methyltransferase [Treponema sp.]|uniref:DNA cytosine methyltransferase n=1 Tax=Treponema sp. TaxID=166 RepID=UPI00388D269D
MKLKVFESFAGYGGASFALKRLERLHPGWSFNVVGYSEISPSAIELYNANHKAKSGKQIKNWGDITSIDEKKLPAFDLFTGGFPCQPFSSAGSLLGELDPRGSLFADIYRICREKKPKYIFLENVVNLCRGKCKPTFEAILGLFYNLGYDIKTAILNSADYGIPQSRQRLWFFGARKDIGGLPEGFSMEPPKVKLEHYIEDFLDEHPDESLYRTQKQIEHIKVIHDKPADYFHVNERLCYDYYNRKIRSDRICMTVTPPSHNVVRIVEPPVNGMDRFRKLSTDEHFRLMGFRINDEEKEIVYPEKLTYSQLGERAGNGWEINVVTTLLEHIFKQL